MNRFKPIGVLLFLFSLAHTCIAQDSTGYGKLTLVLKDANIALQEKERALEQMAKMSICLNHPFYKATFIFYQCLIKINKGDCKGQIKELSKVAQTYNNLDSALAEAMVLKQIALCMEKTGDALGALKHYEQAKSIKDSLERLIYLKNSDSIESQYKSTLKQKEIAALTKELDRKQMLRTGMYFILGLTLLVVALIIYYILDSRKKSRRLNLINIEIEKQQHEISEKNRLILESLDYAQYLQQALLSTETKIQKLVPSFLIYKPKDVVSGDFVFTQALDKHKILFCIIDCTGHGIPGSFISLFAHQALNHFLKSTPHFSPKELITALHHVFSETLTSRDSEVKESLEIICAILNKESNTLSYSGTGNVMYRVHQGNIEEFKFSYFPLGDSLKGNPEEIIETSIQLHPGEQIYFFTDGFADQKGGEKGKKFFYGRLRELVLQISEKDLAQQKEILESTLMEHMKNLPQTDDITVVGIKI